MYRLVGGVCVCASVPAPAQDLSWQQQVMGGLMCVSV